MVEAGMTGIRMNLSHGPLSAHKDWLDICIHAVGITKLLIDLQGPELRIGTSDRGPLFLDHRVRASGWARRECPLPSGAGAGRARPGQDLLLDDGRLLCAGGRSRVGAALQCTVVRGGTLQSRKSLAAPGAGGGQIPHIDRRGQTCKTCHRWRKPAALPG